MQVTKRAAAITTIALALTRTAASGATPNPRLNVPVTCEFQSTWTKKACTVAGNTFPWNYSTKQINATPKNSKVRATVIELCADDTFVQWPYAKYVVKGDTLWNIAARAYGNGQKYKTIMTLNTMRSTRLEVGRWIIVKELPKECVAAFPYAR